MKKLCVLLSCLLAANAFATPINAHLPKSARVSHAPLKTAKPVKAQMSCDLYHFDEFYNPTLLTTRNSPIFNVGTPTSVSVDFPAPYQDLSVRFDHYNVEFAIDNFSTVRPLISAAIISAHTHYSDYKNATFSIENANTGSSITLDTGYLFEDKILLSSICSITFLK